MNRRTLFSKLAALPFIGFLFRPLIAAPVAPIVEAVPMQHSSQPTASFLLNRGLTVDEHMVMAGREITDKINILIRECERDGIPLKRCDIVWRNIRESDFNPDGNLAFFRIIGYRGDVPPDRFQNRFKSLPPSFAGFTDVQYGDETS